MRSVGHGVLLSVVVATCLTIPFAVRAQVTIGNLPPVTVPALTDVAPVTQGYTAPGTGTTAKESVAQILSGLSLEATAALNTAAFLPMISGPNTSPFLTPLSYLAGTGLSLTSGGFNVVYGTTAGTAAQGNDTRVVNALQTTGGTMTGALTLAANPTQALQAATKQYVDTSVGNYLPLSGGVLTGNLVLAGAPTASLQYRYSQSSPAVRLEMTCGGNASVDTPALASVVAAAAAAGMSSGIAVHGQCVINTAIAATLAYPLAIIGDGPGVTTFTFPNATDGFDFTLTKTSATTWGAVQMSGLSILRSNTSGGTYANTGVSIVLSPAAGAGYTGSNVLRDVVFSTTNPNTNVWKNPVVMQSITGAYLDNIGVFGGINPAGSDHGDIAFDLLGSNFQTNPGQPGVAYTLINPIVVGYSCGVCVSGFVQDVSIVSPDIIDNYDSVRWNNLLNTVALSTTGSTGAGTNLQFTPGSLGSVTVGQYVAGPGITTYAQVSAVNNLTGAVTVTPAVSASTGSQSFQFSIAQGAEGLQITGGTLAAEHAEVYGVQLNLNTINGVVMTRQDNTASPAYGVLCDECYATAVTANVINGAGASFPGGNNSGITLRNYDYYEPGNTVTGNNISATYVLPAIQINGATIDAMVSGNTCHTAVSGCAGADLLGNTLGPNEIDGQTDGVQWSGSPNSGNDLMLWGTPTAPAFNITENSGTGQTVNNIYAQNNVCNFILNADTTSYRVNRCAGNVPLDQPFAISASTGLVTMVDGAAIAGITISAHAISTQATAPTVAQSGGSGSTSLNTQATDIKGTMTEGVSATGAVVTFSTAYATAPDCIVSSPTGTALSSYTPTTTTLTLTHPAASGAKFTYVCIQ